VVGLVCVRVCMCISLSMSFALYVPPRQSHSRFHTVCAFNSSALSVFLHPMVFDGVSGSDNGRVLIAAMDAFLTIADKHGMKASFAFFDDCWNHAGANLTVPCVPVKGRHNGCWMAAPQDVDRTSVERYKSYVSTIVSTFKDDGRIAFWEIFNEPNRKSTYSITLRSAAYNWAVEALGAGARKVRASIDCVSMSMCLRMCCICVYVYHRNVT
jgi:hypothetical protein